MVIYDKLARAEAAHLIEVEDGRAASILEARIDTKLAQSDLFEALHLDRVRREVLAIHDENGEEPNQG